MEARWCSVDLSTSEASKRRGVRGVEPAGSGEARFPFPAALRKDDSSTRSSEFLPGEISWPPHGTFPWVVVEDERTKRQWDKRSRMAA